MSNVNRKYKSTVFTKLFSEEYAVLELYNALTGSNYSSDTVIEINTLEDVLFMDMINDVSFTVDDKIVVLIEHQSSISENLPLRLFLYIARVYEGIIDKKATYRQKLLKIPTPEFIVLYNGKNDFPDEKELRLSDAFKEKTEHSTKYGNLDLVVRVLYINPGHNLDIVRKSETLRGYVVFISKIRECINKGLKLDIAIAESVKYCERQDILQPFFAKHASEVLNMLSTEFNMEDAISVWKEEGREEGREEGIMIGEARIIKLMEAGYSCDDIKKMIISN
jgi:hypothetical protein